mgnify:CR=1 FL=1
MKHSIFYYFFHLDKGIPALKAKISDRYYIEQQWKRIMDYPLDLDNPKTFNEKIQWLKIYNRKSQYTLLADKYRVKEVISKTLGKQFVIPTLSVYSAVNQIKLSELPEQFVLKCNHDSGSIILCEDKSTFDLVDAQKKLSIALKRNYYSISKEWVYRNIKPCIIAEPYLKDDKEKDLHDYKFFVFNGKVRCFKIDFLRYTNHGANYYDCEGNILPFGENCCKPQYDRHLDIPEQLPQLINFAEKIAKDIPFLRVDFYIVNGHIFFGERTFYPTSGYGTFTEKKWDDTLGDWLQLPSRKKCII